MQVNYSSNTIMLKMIESVVFKPTLRICIFWL